MITDDLRSAFMFIGAVIFRISIHVLKHHIRVDWNGII